MTWLFVIAGVVAALYIAGRAMPNTPLGRFVRFGRGQVNKASHAAVAVDPLADRQQIIDDAAGEVRAQQQNLAKYGAMIDGAIRDVDDLTNEVGTLEANIKKRVERIKELREAGQGDSAEAKRIETGGVSKAAELAQKKKLLATAEANLAKYRKNHEDAIERLKKANDKVKNAQTQQKTLGAELKMSEFDKAMAEATGTLVGGDSALGNLDEATKAVRARIDENVNSAKVVKILEDGDDFDKQFEVSAEEQAGRDLFGQMLGDDAKKATTPPASEPKQ